MDAIDTQEIIDFLTRGEKAEKLEKYLRELEKRKGKVFLSSYTLLELVYLLEHVLGVERQRIVRSLKTILEDKLFKVEGKGDMERALEMYHKGMDFLQALKEAQYSRVGAKRLVL